MAQTKGLYIPETPGELTPEWLSSVLGADDLPSPKISAIQQQVLGEGEGFLGDLLRLTLAYEPASSGANSPASLIAKLPKLANRTMGELLGAYERENMFYLEFAQELPVATPKLYYAELDRDAGSEKQGEILRMLDGWPVWTHGAVSTMGRWVAAGKKRRYILLIEDINDADPGDQVSGATLEQAQTVLGELAKLHARYWRADRLNGHFWLLPLDIDGRMKHAFSKKSRPVFDKTFADILDAGLAPHVDSVMDSYIQDLQTLCQGPETLLHGDMRLDNVFFKQANPNDVVFFDWQLVRRGPAAYDLAYLLSGSLTPESGSAEPLLDFYHAALIEHGVSDYSRDQLEVDYRLGLRVVLGSLVTVDQMNLGDGRGLTMMRLWIERLHGRLQALMMQ